MRFADVIARKRDGQALTRGEIDLFIRGIADGTVADYQAAALLMAIVLRGMDDAETIALTEAMVASGERVDLSDIPGPTVGKHSTGGVGDKVSIIVTPLVAACGVIVPKMSGRGLGHTGGTIDKLEAIPGFRVDATIAEFRQMLRDTGAAIVGQSPSLAPADKTLYALRDVTATVESIPLICASIMSKKLAEGSPALVLDVKCGDGALMKSEAAARELARLLVSIGTRAGLRVEALLTRMDAPLGRAVGNAVEIVECLNVLKGGGPAELRDLCLIVATRMLVLSGRYDEASAGQAARDALASGAALEKLRALIARQGGDARVVEDDGRLPRALRSATVEATRAGYVATVRAALIGRAAGALGAGRSRVDDPIDRAAGIILARAVGEQVRPGDPILELQFNDGAAVDEALTLARAAITIGERPPERLPLVIDLCQAN